MLGLPCAAGLLAGAALLARQDSPSVLFASAVAAVSVLVLALLAGAATLPSYDLRSLLVLVVLALPLPVLVAVFARLPRVQDWAAEG